MSFALAREKAAVFSDWLLHATVAAHESGHFLNAFQRKGRLAQGLHGDGHQLHRVVVRRHTVGTESAAALAAVDDGPFAVFSYPDGDGLHDTAAVRGTVAGLNVHVQAGKAIGAVVAVVAAGVLGSAKPVADLAGKAVVAGVGLVIAFFKGFPLVFAVHSSILLKICVGVLREEWRVLEFARHPGQPTRSSDNVVSFKKFSLH